MARSIAVGPRGARLSRLKQFAKNHLGVIMVDQMAGYPNKYRKEDLDLLDQYYEGTQYDDLQEWQEASESEDYVSIRKRKPRVMVNLPKLVVDKVAAKLVGQSTFPSFVVEEDPDDTSFFATVVKGAKLRRNLIDPIKRLLVSGSVFVRYTLVGGQVKIEWANSKFCWPQFDAAGNLDTVEIKYIYEDQNDKDAQGNYKRKWYRLILTKTTDTLYDTPEYRENVEPQFTVVNQLHHELGWVQGEWLRTGINKFDPDGAGLFGDEGVRQFCDDINYSLSQSSQATSYGQDPQLTMQNVDQDEMDTLVKSSSRIWNLGREGVAEFVETELKAVEQAREGRNESRQLMFDVIRIVIHDPEKVSGNAQSGKALEILHAPLIELIDELRAMIEVELTALVIKIGLTCLVMAERGLETAIQAPAGYFPSSLDIMVQWPALFPATLEDIASMAQSAQLLSQAEVVSRETLTRWIASNTNIIENVDEELTKIAAQPPLPSPFGTFDSGGGQ